MRIIDHHIVGPPGGGSACTADVFDPNAGQATVALGGQAVPAIS